MMSENKKEIRLGNIFNATGGNHAGMVYDKFALAPTLNAMQGGYKFAAKNSHTCVWDESHFSLT